VLSSRDDGLPSCGTIVACAPDLTNCAKMVNLVMTRSGLHSIVRTASRKREAVLVSAIGVFGQFGFKKTSVDDLAKAAGLSKQGLYLHFASKEEIFLAAIHRYWEDGLRMVREELARPDVSLADRLEGAMDAWFGRHLATFTRQSLDVIEVVNRLSPDGSDKCKSAVRTELAKAIANSREFKKTNMCTPREIAQVLFQFGLTWKEEQSSRTEFMKKVALCIRACCQTERRQVTR
jgi:TetR/AcrR family transcriptional regulator, regulator of autoinduction and epiphytic fitness